ncbi:MAG: RCC1 domain-containing protein [Methylobacter sp.]
MNKIKTLITLLACFVSIASLPFPSNATTVGIGYTAVTAGEQHTVALKTDGSLWAWGNNTYGQLGDGSTIQSVVPKQIGTGYRAISAGYNHTVALKTDGGLWAWGSNTYGQLGDGSTTQSLEPKQVGTGYSAISAGYSHTIALKTDGSLWAWGSNTYGELGDGSTVNSLVPKQISTVSCSAISAGNGHSVALKSDGSLWTWGSNSSGQLGDGTTTQSLVPKQIGIDYSAISADSGYSMALKSDGSLWVWGSNYAGRLGDGNTFNGFMPQLSNVLAPKQIGTGAVAIEAGGSHSLGLRSDGSLWAWGNNSYGQLGYGTIASSLVPKQIGTDTYSAIASGNYHTVALKSDGSLWAWGGNYYGQLGDGTTTDSLVPKQIIDTGTPDPAPDTTAPSIPAGLSVTTRQTTSTNGNYVNLFWTPSTDNVAVSMYKIYREGVWTGGGTTANSITETGLSTDRFTVSACDAAGNCSVQSAAASVTSTTQAPSAPTGFTATAVSATQINLAWTASAGNIGDVTYEIYRISLKNCVSPPGLSLACDTGPDRVTNLLTTLSQQTSYTDTGLTPLTPYETIFGVFGSTYSYFVRSCDAAGNCSAPTDPISTTTQALPVTLKTPPTATGISYGPLSNQTIRITLAPPTNIPNLSGSTIFVAAVLPSSMGGRHLLLERQSLEPFQLLRLSPSIEVMGS